jgi:4-alpha-glucanotransferase
VAALDALATRNGIEPSFLNALGEQRRTSPDTQRALLAAMGVQADNEAQAQAALQASDRADWERALPPVRVACSDPGPVTVDLVLPSGTGEVAWRVALEEGGEIDGRASFAALALRETGELEGQRLERRRLALEGLPWGYHRLSVQPGGGETVLIVTPGTCWLPPAVDQGQRLWGVAAQLYLLRSAGDWGIGDFGDLRRLVGLLAARGADVVGLNPLHAMFLDAPEHASPYSPASRLLLNVLNIDVASLPELAGCAEAQALVASAEFQGRLEACRAAALLDYAGVAALKVPVLRLLFAACRTAADAGRWGAFEAFRRNQGAAFERGCVFLALRQHFAGLGQAQADWHGWPEEYRDPAAPAVGRFAAEHADLVAFHAWLQWLADTQLAAAAAAADGMAIGLYRDLAVGADRAGAETWSGARTVVADAQVGAPPDIYNPAGQDWGLPPFHPRALREEAYRSFVDLVRANMRHAGGLRIDHVMALQHLYWVPRGRPPQEGAYVSYPLDDLVGILALESQRHRCLVVGEDLGTVPEGFRERMAEARILSYRVLFFEKDEDGFLPPGRYPALALAVAGSHDLPTLRGWWEAGDIALKERLHLYPDADGAAKARQERMQDREQLLAALRAEGLLPRAGEVEVEALVRAAHSYLGRSRSALAVAQIDDITDEAEPVNVPSTSDERPNWRRRLSLTLEQLSAGPRLDAVSETLAAGRGKPRLQAAAQPDTDQKRDDT